MTDIVERLRARCDHKFINALCEDAAAEIEQLRTALEPFARNVDAVSLFEALGHIKREHLHNARAALELKP